MKKKTIIIISIIISIIILGLGFYKLYNYLRIKNAKIEITLKEDLRLEFTDKKKVSDYIESINGKIVDNYVIDSTKLGEKEVPFEFVNDDGIKLNYSYKVKVVDTKRPVIWLGNSYSIKKDSEDTLKSSILCGDNHDKKPLCIIEGTYDLSVADKYPLVYKAIDSSGNTNVQEFTLNVYDPSNNSNNSSNDTKVEYTDFSVFKEKYKNDKTMIGIDVSAWQDEIDFKKLKESGVEFIIIRVGGTLTGNRTRFLDKRFEYNIKNANKYGIKVGVYYYSIAKTKEEALEDAKFVYKHIKKYKVELPVAFDWEEWGLFNSYNISFYDLTKISEAYLDYFKEKGYKTMNYSSKNYLEKIWVKNDHDVWLAHYVNETDYEGKYSYWQVSSEGTVSGINGAVDIDIYYKKTLKK